MRPPEPPSTPTHTPAPTPAPAPLHAPDPTDADAARRNFLNRSYPTMKKHNPHTPIMIREASGIEPTVFARYGASEAPPLPSPPAPCELTRRTQTLARRRSCRSRASTTSPSSSPSPSLCSPRYRCAGVEGKREDQQDERTTLKIRTCPTRGAGAVPVYIDECTCSSTHPLLAVSPLNSAFTLFFWIV